MKNQQNQEKLNEIYPEICIVCGKPAKNLFFCKIHDPAKDFPTERGVWEAAGEVIYELNQKTRLRASNKPINHFKEEMK